MEIFNKHKYFISYDPLTFLIIIATLCGCIAIVHQIENKNKQDWLKTTAIWPYLEENNLDYINGVAYGKDDIFHACKTINLASKQWEDILKYNKEKSLLSFINDIQNFDAMQNTVQNNFYVYNNENINLGYVLEFNEDIKYLIESKKYDEFLEKIKIEDRIYNEETFYKKYNNFDIYQYKSSNSGLENLSEIEIMKDFIKNS
jgi:hypothetical protein